MTGSAAAALPTMARAHCPLCGTTGQLEHPQLRDYLFGVPGTWSLKRCPAPACGLRWLDPAPSPTALPQAYQSYYTHAAAPQADAVADEPTRWLYCAVRAGYWRWRYGYTQGVGPPWYQLLAPLAHLYPAGSQSMQASLMFLAAPHGKQRLLDVGCGSGGLMKRLQGLGWQVEGIDFDPQAVAAARAKGLVVRQGDLLDQTDAPASFDVITLSHVIEHVYAPLELVQHCFTLLRPGGRLVLMTPNVLSWGAQRFGQDWRGLEPPRHLQLFTPTALTTLLNQVGFSQVRVRTTAQGAHYILPLSAQLAQARQQQASPIGFAGASQRWQRMAWQYAARLWWLVRPTSGEEIVAGGVRP